MIQNKRGIQQKKHNDSTTWDVIENFISAKE